MLKSSTNQNFHNILLKLEIKTSVMHEAASKMLIALGSEKLHMMLKFSRPCTSEMFQEL